MHHTLLVWLLSAALQFGPDVFSQLLLNSGLLPESANSVMGSDELSVGAPIGLALAENSIALSDGSLPDSASPVINAPTSAVHEETALPTLPAKVAAPTLFTELVPPLHLDDLVLSKNAQPEAVIAVVSELNRRWNLAETGLQRGKTPWILPFATDSESAGVGKEMKTIFEKVPSDVLNTTLYKILLNLDFSRQYSIYNSQNNSVSQVNGDNLMPYLLSQVLAERLTPDMVTEVEQIAKVDPNLILVLTENSTLFDNPDAKDSILELVNTPSSKTFAKSVKMLTILKMFTTSDAELKNSLPTVFKNLPMEDLRTLEYAIFYTMAHNKEWRLDPMVSEFVKTGLSRTNKANLRFDLIMDRAMSGDTEALNTLQSQSTPQELSQFPQRVQRLKDFLSAFNLPYADDLSNLKDLRWNSDGATWTVPTDSTKIMDQSSTASKFDPVN